MARIHADWLQSFIQYSKHGEAPTRMYFWAGVSAIAGALRRRVWIDQAYFKWIPNFYIVIVAPPGIVSKSTTADVGMGLLKEVPGVKFGPNIVTWQALVKDFADSQTAFELDGVFHPMSAMTIVASELGNLLDTGDPRSIDLLVDLWDGKEGALKKLTVGDGGSTVENPFINIIGCTTPSWIAGNVPEYMIGGGFTSRCVFVYADRKQQLIAYPKEHVPANLKKMKEDLVADLTRISEMAGEMHLTPEAMDFGRRWYEQHYSNPPKDLSAELFGGYLARKQTHAHKLAMVLSASEGETYMVTKEHLQTAVAMLTDLEPDMAGVFQKIGKSNTSAYLDRLLDFLRRHGEVSYTEFYRFAHSYFPSMREFEDVLAGLIRAGTIKVVGNGSLAKVALADA